MTTSAIGLEGEVLFVRGAALREFIKAVVFHLPEKIIDNPEVGWLAQACFTWVDDHENIPPDLKDIVLDEWLSVPQRKLLENICSGLNSHLHLARSMTWMWL